MKQTILSLVLLISLSAFAQTEKTYPIDAINKKLKEEKAGYTSDEEKYSAAIKANPKDADAYFNRGKCRMALNDGLPDKTIKDFKKAIRLKTAKADTAYYLIGKIQDGIFRSQSGISGHVAAIKYYTKAIKLNPNYTQAYFYRGLALYNTDKFKKAVDDFTKTLSLDNNCCAADCYLYRGLSKFGTKGLALRGFDEEGGCQDLSKAASFGNQSAKKFMEKHCK
jgi:tetratricopeptide (TPR) repeat protein